MNLGSLCLLDLQSLLTRKILHILVQDDSLNDLETFGFLFETLCVRDLRVFADALAPIQGEYTRYLNDKAYLNDVLKDGATKASRIANRMVSKVYKKVGLYQL